MESIIEMISATKQFKNEIALNKVSFKVGKGEIFGFLGPSGAGKTTTIKVLTGQIKLTSGSAYILNKQCEKINYDFYKNIGVVTDNSGIIQESTCYGNLKIFAQIYGVNNNRINYLLKRVGLDKARNKKGKNLSNGMRQRLVLARALLHKPKVLFLDEPTSGLDPKTTKDIHELIMEEKDRGVTIFLTTHNMTEAEKLCDYIALINNGAIIESDHLNNMKKKYQKNFEIKVIYENSSELILKSLDELAKIGIREKERIVSVHSSEPNLNDIFLLLTGRNLYDFNEEF
ncbi:ABC transporter ATP-binding protein [Enterococcus faecalis]|uniref:ABC transporter ATP-binding protein n=1 Tax=Enterococcus faecalis TaxID=1351 RepID=UPI003D11A0E6